ncbi:MAG TPA: hypothetical protein VG651_23560 [Stellaceae bacterium]|nr:hypothetical protein [Stellaceae bacterium]
MNATTNFSAADLRRRMAERETAKAAEAVKRLEEEQARQKAIIEEFHKPPARTPDQLMALVMQVVDKAAERGESEVQVYQFPSALCSDRGRAINNYEADWYKTLSGRPQLAYEFWEQHLKPLGFGLRAQILDYPGGFPGDVGLSLTW